MIEREFWLLILARFFEIENSRQCLVLVLIHELNYAGIVLGVLMVELGVVQRPENLVIIANWKNFEPPQFILRVYYKRNNSVWMVSILSGPFQYCHNFNSLQTVLILPESLVRTASIMSRQF